MTSEKENFHKLLHIQFENGHNAAQAARNINALLGQDVVSPKAAQYWFRQFRQGRSSTERKKGSGRPPTVDKRVLAQRLRRNPDASCSELAAGHCHKTTAWRHLRKSGRKPRKSRHVPHDLTPQQKEKRVEACLQLLRKHQQGHFFSRLVTCDESWVYYDGRARKVVWQLPGEAPAITPKRDLHGKKTDVVRFLVPGRPRSLGAPSKRHYHQQQPLL